MKILQFNQRTLTQVMMALLPFGAAAQGIHIGTGSSMVITGSPIVVINNGGLINDGSFSAGGSTIKLTGTTGPTISGVGGASTLALNTLSVNKTSGDVQINRDISIKGLLDMEGGNLQLNRHTLDLGTTGLIVNESEGSRIAGINAGRVQVKVNLEANSPVPLDPGNVGLFLTASIDGTYNLVRMNTVENLPGGGKGIQRNFSISGPAGAHLIYKLRYFNAELNGNAEQSLVIYATDRAGNVLTSIGRTGNVDTVNNIITRGDTVLFGHITAGAGSATGASGAVTKASQANAAALQTDGSIGGVTRAYPNPAHDQVTVDLIMPAPGSTVISLFDQSGHLMQQKRMNVNTGRNSITWDLSKFPAGIYYVSAEGQGSQIMKIIKE